MEFQSQLNDEHLTNTIRRLIGEHYEIGELTHVKEILGGYCNKSYEIWMSDSGRDRRYFLRLYNPNVTENEILFEHKLLDHLKSKGFTLSASIVPCRNGKTVVHTHEIHRGNSAFWTLFEFLEGEAKYSWTSTNLTDHELASAAEILAHLHHCGHGFKKPPGADRVQPRIMEFIPTFKNTCLVFMEQANERRCDLLIKDNLKTISKTIDYGISFYNRFKGMKELPIHCDYHPGNLKYRDGKGVGIFDFDWSKIDYRLFDVALSLIYFTSIWDDRIAELRQEKFILFLNTYNKSCRQFTHIFPLTKLERSCMIPMLSIANLYVLNWALVEFCNAPRPDDNEYYSFLNHNIGLMHWIVLQEKELELWVNNS